MTITPYWRGKGITLYHADCRDILPHIKGAVTITDPPYNCGVNYGETTNDRQPWPEWCAWFDEILELCQAATPDVLAFMSQTAARKYQRLGSYEPDWALAWVKPLALACTALPFMPHWEAILYWGKTRKRDNAFWGGDVLTCNVAKDDLGHPTPKPMPLMRELVSRFDGPIVDPFAGSGTTLRACLELGKEAVGVEVNEEYCAMAVRRLERWHKEPETQAVMALEVAP